MGEMESSECADVVPQLEGVGQSENSSLDGLPLGNRFQTVVGGASEVDSAQYTGCARLGSSYRISLMELDVGWSCRARPVHMDQERSWTETLEALRRR